MIMKEYIILFIKGVIIGIANAIPGVSGGTLAFILGIYERLTNAIAIIPSIILKPKQWASPMKTLIPIGLGAIIAIVAFLRIINFLFDNYAIQTQLFFVGLVLGSLPFIAKEIKVFGLKNTTAFFLGATLMATFIYFEVRSSIGFKESVYSTMSVLYGIKLFAAGILAAAAMVIPGVSGSLLLLMIGEYQNISSFVKNMEIVPLAIVGLGILIGLFSITKLISIVIAKYRERLFAFVLALIIVSLLSLMPNVSSIGTLPTVLSSAFSICLGFVLAIAIEKL